MFGKIKKLFQPSIEDIELAERIKKVFKTHDVTIVRNVRGWRISVEKKKK